MTLEIPIKNAWLKIFTIMPSISINDTLYHNGTGEILTAYSYDTQLPTEKIAGDCRTEYELSTITENLKIYVNEEYIGTNILTSYSLEEDASLRGVAGSFTLVSMVFSRSCRWEARIVESTFFPVTFSISGREETSSTGEDFGKVVSI